MASLDSPTGTRTSSWPVRNQRRHEATVTFNAAVLSSLEQILGRLQLVEERLTLDATYNPLSCKLDAILEEVTAMQAGAQIKGLADRINCLEAKWCADMTHEGSVLKKTMLTSSDQLNGKIALMSEQFEPLHRPCGELGMQDFEGKNEYFGVVTIDAGVQVGDVTSCRRQLNVSSSDASTAAPFEEIAPRSSDWHRLVDTKLAASRLAHLRELAAAPASVRAMVNRGCDHSDSDNEEDACEGCDEVSVATTVSFLANLGTDVNLDEGDEALELSMKDGNDESDAPSTSAAADAQQNEEQNEKQMNEAQTAGLVDALTEILKDVSSYNDDGTKRSAEARVAFALARLASGGSMAAATAEGMKKEVG